MTLQPGPAILALLLQAAPQAPDDEPASTRQVTLRPLREASADDRAEGERIYQAHCASCHGLRGEGGRGSTLAVPVLPRARDDRSLVRVIRSGIDGTDMPRSRLDPPAIWQVAAFVQALGQVKPEAMAGDARRGEQLYATKGGCAVCHAIRGYGGAMGPDLTSIGLRRGAAYLRRSLTDPAADVPKSFSSDPQENFLQVRAVTREGKQLMGVRVNEDTFTLQMRDLAGRVHSVDKSSLRELHKEWGKSSMPAYGNMLSSEELDDLVAFMASLQGK